MRALQLASSSLLVAAPVSVAVRHCSTRCGPPPPGAAGDALTVESDDMTEWVGGYVDRAVSGGRQTPEAAAYFNDILHDKPEFADCLREAKRLTGGQDPSRFTPYQQGLFADRLGHYMSGVASRKLMHVQQEEQQCKSFSKDGTPTGEQYWYEAGTTLSSPSVPSYVKDEIFTDMQRDRRPDSPAFEEVPEVSELADADKGFAEDMRRRKCSLLSGVDFGSPQK